MITLEVEDLVVIAGRTLRLDTAQVLDLLDLAAAERALAQAQPGGMTDQLATQAVVLLDALLHRRPLRRGNQQVALAAMLQFLALNGQEMEPDPPGPVATLVADLAAGAVDIRTAADRLAARLRPAGPPAVGVREAPMPGRRVAFAMRLRDATMRVQPTGMFARFTERARRVCYLAQEEARLLRHDYVGTEHLLLALLYERDGVAARALQGLGLSRAAVQGQVEEVTGPGTGSRTGPIPFSPPAKKALELSLREALALGHHYIGTEHILLGLFREGHSAAAQVLTRLGTDHAGVREQVVALRPSRREQEDPDAHLADDLVDAAERLTQVRRDKEAAFGAGDLDAAAARRDQERQLLATKRQLENQLTAGGETMMAGTDQAIVAENRRLRRELERLRELLRQHGVEPDSGTARTA